MAHNTAPRASLPKSRKPPSPVRNQVKGALATRTMPRAPATRPARVSAETGCRPELLSVAEVVLMRRSPGRASAPALRLDDAIGEKEAHEGERGVVDDAGELDHALDEVFEVVGERQVL